MSNLKNNKTIENIEKSICSKVLKKNNSIIIDKIESVVNDEHMKINIYAKKAVFSESINTHIIIK